MLKKLFLFHENLINDYFHWKQMNYKGTKIRRTNSRSMPNHLSSSWSDRLSLQSNSTSQTTELVEHELEDIRIWYHQPKNILVLKLKTEKSIEEVKKISFNWSSFVESYELEEFSEHYRYVMQNKGRKWILKLKVDMELLGKEAKEGKEGKEGK